MTEEEKWKYILDLDDHLLKGGVVLSEWSAFLVRDAETAFCSGANLAAILAAQAAIEAHLRYEYFNVVQSKGWGLYKLIEKSNLPSELEDQLHILRKYRNKWVHVEHPQRDDELLSRPEYYGDELERMAKLAIETMLKVVYSEQFV